MIQLNEKRMGSINKTPHTLRMAGDKTECRVIKETKHYVYTESQSGHAAVFQKLVFDRDWPHCTGYYMQLVAMKLVAKKDIEAEINKYYQKFERADVEQATTPEEQQS